MLTHSPSQCLQWLGARRRGRVVGLLSTSLLGLLSGTLSGCLPDPDIVVPDFMPPPIGDGGVLGMDAAKGDQMSGITWRLDTTTGTMETLLAVWAADPQLNEVFAVGHNGLILHRTGGGQWMKETSGTLFNLYAVSAVAPDNVYVTGGNGLILHRLPTGRWMPEGNELGTTANLYGVLALASGDVMAVGEGGLVARRGSAGVWMAEPTTMLPANTDLKAIAGTQLDDLLAVGGATSKSVIARRVVDHWETDTATVDPMDQRDLYAITRAGGAVYAAGKAGLLLHRSATRWTAEATVKPMMGAPPDFYSLWTDGTEVVAVGADGAIQRKGGTPLSWTLEQSGITKDLYGVGGRTAPALLAVGMEGSLLRRM